MHPVLQAAWLAGCATGRQVSVGAHKKTIRLLHLICDGFGRSLDPWARPFLHELAKSSSVTGLFASLKAHVDMFDSKGPASAIPNLEYLRGFQGCRHQF